MTIFAVLVESNTGLSKEPGRSDGIKLSVAYFRLWCAWYGTSALPVPYRSRTVCRLARRRFRVTGRRELHARMLSRIIIVLQAVLWTRSQQKLKLQRSKRTRPASQNDALMGSEKENAKKEHRGHLLARFGNQKKASLDEPPLRHWGLHENSTKWDISHAAPSDSFLERTWTAWSTLFFVCCSIYRCC